MTALRRPYLAAATATLVALPPIHLPKASTSSSPTPDCNGYRSTPTRPIVRTSRALTRVAPASALPPWAPWKVGVADFLPLYYVPVKSMFRHTDLLIYRQPVDL